MKCPVCGSEIERGKHHCDVCGSDLVRRTQQHPAHSRRGAEQRSSVELDESQIARSTVTELKETRAAYKEARRNAGKTNTPRVIAVILAMLAAAVAASIVTWYLVNEAVASEKLVLEQRIVEAESEIAQARADAMQAEERLKEAEEKLERYEKALAQEALENAEAAEAEKTDEDDGAEESKDEDGSGGDPTSLTGATQDVAGDASAEEGAAGAASGTADHSSR